MNYIQRVPPKYSTKIHYLVVVSRTITGFLTKTIFGTLLILIFVYFILLSTKFNKPYSLNELLTFFNSLTSDYKIAIASSLITILGFLFAFHAATLVWKQQTIANIKIAAGNQIFDFFNEVMRIATSISIYARNLSTLANDIKAGGPSPRTSFTIKYLSEQRDEIESKRNKLADMSSQAFLIQSNNFVALVDSDAARTFLQQATAAFNEITNDMWFFYPVVKEDAPEPEKQFLAQLEIEKVSKFLQTSDKKILLIGSIASGLKVLLIAPVMSQGLYALRDLFDKNKRNQTYLAFELLYSDFQSRKK